MAISENFIPFRFSALMWQEIKAKSFSTRYQRQFIEAKLHLRGMLGFGVKCVY